MLTIKMWIHRMKGVCRFSLLTKQIMTRVPAWRPQGSLFGVG